MLHAQVPALPAELPATLAHPAGSHPEEEMLHGSDVSANEHVVLRKVCLSADTKRRGSGQA